VEDGMDLHPLVGGMGLSPAGEGSARHCPRPPPRPGVSQARPVGEDLCRHAAAAVRSAPTLSTSALGRVADVTISSRHPSAVSALVRIASWSKALRVAWNSQPWYSMPMRSTGYAQSPE